MNKRVEALKAYLTEAKLDAMVIGSEANRSYLSGFTGSNALLDRKSVV